MKEDSLSGRTLAKMAAVQNVKEKDYWLNRLSGHWVKSVFPYDFKEGKSNRPFESETFELCREPFTYLLKISNNSDHRLFMILVALLKVLIYKYTENNDIIVGIPIYKQKVKGAFINTVLAIRNRFDDDVTFKELLLQVRQSVFEAVEHQNYPIETLLYKLNLSNSPGSFPLFDIAILLENIHDKDYLSHIHTNLVFNFRKTDMGIEGELEYYPSLYTAATIKGIISHYLQLMRDVRTILEKPLSDIDILSSQERQRVLVDFNNTAADYPVNKTIHQWFEEQVLKTPENIAVVESPPGIAGEAANPATITYRQLNEKSNQLAHLLRKRGVKPDFVVAILMESSIHRIIGILGILKAGAAYLPIDTEYPEKRILSIMEEGGCSLVLTDENLLNHVTFTGLRNIKFGAVEPFRSPPRQQITDFDGLPLVDRTLIDYQKYHRYIGEAMAKHKITLQATRGCPYHCLFCHKIWPKNHIRRSPENIFQEIQYNYNAGIRRFALIDDIFNLDRESSGKLLREIIRRGLDIQIFFPNGLRADILTRDYIDLMVEAGTVNIDVALESASPRIQKLIRKNLNLEKFYENVNYITQKHPHVILEMEMILGFPTETQEEAMMTLDFLKQFKWVHFPNLHILKIYPTSDMARLAMENGISEDAIERSSRLAFHQLPETLPFPKAFAREIQSRFMNEYFLAKERLINVLPFQARFLARDELVDKYDSYLPAKIESFSDILDFAGIANEELGSLELLPDGWMAAPDFNERIKSYFPPQKKSPDAFKVLLLDISQFFTNQKEQMLHNMNDEPLGLMYLLSYLNDAFGHRVTGHVFKAGIDFNSFQQLQEIINNLQPHLVGIRALSYYQEFFHKTVSLLRNWGVTVPIISGGPYATSDYKFVLQDSHLDVVILGEGEKTLAELVEKMIDNQDQLPGQDVLKNIPGISFVTDKDRNRLKQTQRQVLIMEHLEKELDRCPKENPGHINKSNDLFYLISTSGSTGRPKSVMLEHRNMVNLLNFGFTKTKIDFSHRVLQFASIGFDASAQEIFSTLLKGGQLYLVSNQLKNDVFRLLNWIQENEVSVVFLPPSFLRFLFSDAELRARFPRSIRHICAAGEPLVVTRPFRDYLKENQVYLHNFYGPSEAHVVTTFTIDPAGEILETPPIGTPISNTRIYILDKNKRPTPIGVVGELYIAGYNVGRGYYNREDLTAQRYTTDPFEGNQRMYRTGDLARWLPDGNIQFLGRKDTQVKIRGYRIELEEIESQLMKIDFIKEAVVIDLPGDDKYDKYLCGYVVADKTVVAAELMDRLSMVLPEYMVPARFVQIDKIPLNTSGKVDRKLLPHPEIKPDEGYVPPGNAIEKKMVEIWSQVLGMETSVVGIDDNFFELGGHSLKATILLSRLHKAFNVKTSLEEVFNQPTIRGLSQCIRELTEDRFAAIEPVEKKDYYPLSSAQRRLYIQQQVETAGVGYNMPICLELTGQLDREKLAAAFRQLIQRHENLRTSFRLLAEEPVQRIHNHDEVAFNIEYVEITNGSPLEAEQRIKSFMRPFDLSKAPLLRAALIRQEDKQHILAVEMHHIISDGISLEILSREFLQLYSGKILPPLTLQYKDFSEWQNRLLRSGELEFQEQYWLNRFHGDIPVLNLPTDFPRPPVHNYQGNRLFFDLDKGLTVKMNELIVNTNTTFFVLLLTVCNILLWKYTQQEDIVVGTAAAGRRHADLEQIIGMFVNMLALRNQPQGNKTFISFLKEINENTLKALSNQDFQFEDLVRKLNLQRNPARNPLFDAAIHTINMEIPRMQIPGLKLKPYPYEAGTSRFDLVIGCIESDGNTRMYITYSTALFKQSYIEDLQKHLLEILEQVLTNPQIKLADLLLSTKQSTVDSTIPREETLFQF